MKERIKKLRKNLGLTQQKFADRLGLKRQTIAAYEIGNIKPSDSTLLLICKEFGISYLWLTEGIEPMETSLDADSMARIDDIMTGENEFAKNLFKEFAKLDDSEWEMLEKLIKNIAKELE